MGSKEEICKSYQREVLAQIEGWKPQEYFVYFKVFNPMSWGKRSVDSRSGFAHCFPVKTENGRKNTAAKQLSSMAASCGYHILRKLLKNGAPNQEAWTPIFLGTHIQLAGSDLMNNHTFKLLSGLLVQTLHKQNIAPAFSPVNPKSLFRKARAGIAPGSQ